MPMLTTVLDALARGTAPFAGAHPIREVAHAIEDVVNVGHDVLPVDDERRVGGQPQCGVEDGTVLGGVDVLAREHRVTACLDARRLRASSRSNPMVSRSMRCLL